MNLAVPPYVFDDVCPHRKCKPVCGYSAALLAFMYNKYQQFLPEVGGTPRWSGDRHGNRWTKKLLNFVFVFMYIHLHPTADQMPHVLRAHGPQPGINYEYFRVNVIETAYALALAVDEIHYGDRLDRMNHHPFFPVGFTGVVDTFPVYVSQPTNWRVARLLYQAKYVH